MMISGKRRPRLPLTPVGILLVIGIGVLDYLTGPEISFSIFYLVPVFLVSWYRGRGEGIFISLLAALSWLTADFISQGKYSHPLIPYWNAGVRLGFFLLIAVLLAQLRNALKTEKDFARIDFLTGLNNSRAFYDLSDLEIKRAHRYKHPFTLAYIDLDNFKVVNDKFGHVTGDELLRVVAKAIRGSIRETDIASRMGGDEFAILLPETGSEQSRVVTDKVKRNIHEAMKRNNWPVTISMGVATFVNPPESVQKMIKTADDLMYQAKNGGKNLVGYEVWER